MSRAPRFWWEPRPTPAALALAPLGWLHGRRIARRMAEPPVFRAPVPVICIGNFTVGGEGKTPTAIALAALLAGRGHRPGFLTRGHGGRRRGPLLVDPRKHTAREVGDEALLLAPAGPTAVARDRPAGARLLAEQGVTVIVMDDGFQNPSLAKDFALVIADAGRGIGNGLALPAGPLRATLASQLGMTDAFLLVGEGDGAERVVRLAARAGRRLFRGRLRPAVVGGWDREPLIAYAGIGRPQKFFDSLTAAGAILSGRLAFPDHHGFSEREARDLLRRANEARAQLVTTEKDFVRLAGGTGALAELHARTLVFPVRMQFDDPAAMIGETMAAIERAHLRRP